MNANDLFKAVMELDLTPIKTKLMHVESGEGWSLEKAKAVEKEYRRFLCLMKLFPEEDTAPLVDVDTFWHYHILDTMKYAVDCEQVFGYFLHHYPYVGMRGEDDEQFRLDSGERMRELYESLFGEAYPDGIDEHVQAAAYCAGPAPHEPVRAIHVGAAHAYCAGPAPHKQAGNAAAKTAYCAGPAPHKQARNAAMNTAYCAGPAPHKQARNAATNTAYCAGPAPHKQARNAAANTAYCAGPAPHKQARNAAMNTAYCAGPAPHKQARNAATNTAYCAGPAPHAPIRSAGTPSPRALGMA